MNRLAARVRRLDRDQQSGPAWWWGLPFDEWPAGAILAFLRETEGWPPGYQPTGAELDDLPAEGGGGAP